MQPFIKSRTFPGHLKATDTPVFCRLFSLSAGTKNPFDTQFHLKYIKIHFRFWKSGSTELQQEQPASTGPSTEACCLPSATLQQITTLSNYRHSHMYIQYLKHEKKQHFFLSWTKTLFVMKVTLKMQNFGQPKNIYINLKKFFFFKGQNNSRVETKNIYFYNIWQCVYIHSIYILTTQN